MNLQQALEGFSTLKFYQLCGYKYRTHAYHGHCCFDELPASMQNGLLDLIQALYKAQKVVYVYDIDFTKHLLKSCGIKCDAFFKSCGISNYRNMQFTPDRLRAVRMGLIDILIRLLEYVTKKAPTEVEAKPTK